MYFTGFQGSPRLFVLLHIHGFRFFRPLDWFAHSIIRCATEYNDFLLVLIYIDFGGQLANVSPSFSFYLVAITNGAGGLGRYAGGIISDELGSVLFSSLALSNGLSSFRSNQHHDPFRFSRCGRNLHLAFL
jgi:hypothetical protein